MGILDGKVALITGAGQGVGRGIALAMAREGAAIAIVDRNGETAAETVVLIEDLGCVALYRTCDVRNSDEVNACVASVVEALGTVDILVNNAVDARVGIPLQDVNDEEFLISFTSGPFASFWFMRACFPHLRGGGCVINLRSGTENQSMVGYGAYVAAKAAVGGLTRAAAREWGREGITVNALVPFALSPSAEADLAKQPGGSMRSIGSCRFRVRPTLRPTSGVPQSSWPVQTPRSSPAAPSPSTAEGHSSRSRTLVLVHKVRGNDGRVE